MLKTWIGVNVWKAMRLINQTADLKKEIGHTRTLFRLLLVFSKQQFNFFKK